MCRSTGRRLIRVATDFLQFWIGQTDARGQAGQRAYLVPSLECLPCRLKPIALAGSNDQYARHVGGPCKDGKHRAGNLERMYLHPHYVSPKGRAPMANDQVDLLKLTRGSFALVVVVVVVAVAVDAVAAWA